MRKLSLIVVFMVMGMATWAITQPGYVRTISRPNHDSERLDGVLIRVRGNHNPILSTETGDFSILMQDLRTGDPYALSAVMKSGYQLVEQDMIGRNQVGSERVPLIVSMVSTAQLQAERNAIANKARAEVEKRYMEQMAQLEQQLNAKKLEADEYEHRMSELDEQYMRLQSQVEDMAEKYARTDYDALDSVGGVIQQAIEQGDIETAEQMILQKGALSNRQQHIRNMQRDLAAQKEDLKRDYYHLHSISLSRFEPDSAAYYLKLRADLDTTDVAAQLDYAKFVNEYQHDYELAYHYVQCAERQVLQNEGKHSVLMLRVLNEKGQYLCKVQQYALATDVYATAVVLSIELFGKDHKYTATRRVSMGAALYGLGKYKDAKKQLLEAIRIYHLAEQEDAVSEANAKNNLAAISFAEKDYGKARKYMEESVTLLRTASPNNSTLPQTLVNLAAISTYQKDTEAAKQYYDEAYEAARRILGERHSLTKKLKLTTDNLKL